MNLRYLNSAALLLYGYQTGLLMFAVPMAVIWEAQFYINRRWAFSRQDFYQVSDLTGFALLALLIFLFSQRAEYHFVTSLIQWLPILMFPLILLLDYSTTDKPSLDIFFYSLRRQQQPVEQTWNPDYLLFGLVLIAAGTNVNGNFYYFPMVFVLILLTLLRARPRRYPAGTWILLSSIVLALSIGTFFTIEATHTELKQRAQVWLQQWISQRNNALRTRTEIGSLGQLKLSDEILFRVRLNGPSPGLLQEASYDLLSDNSWTVMNTEFEVVPPEEDFKWRIGSRKAGFSADMYLGFSAEKDLIPVPPGVITLDQLPATELKTNQYATLRAYGLVNTPGYSIEYQLDSTQLNSPAPSDRYLPARIENLLNGIPELTSLDSHQPIVALTHYFSDFNYRLYQDTTGAFNAFSNFLTVSKAGHCEYFATATVLILRKMGIPARYTVGYSLQEYNPLIDMYIVRQRHAHAWATAYIDGKWQAVDMTPSTWAGVESGQAIFLQPVFDLVSNLFFLFQLWWFDLDMDDYELYFYFIGVVLALVLGFKIYSSEQVVIDQKAMNGTSTLLPKPGFESELYNLESLLNQQGHIRKPGEGFRHWFQRLGLEHINKLLPIHNQWRFDPSGIDKENKYQLQNELKAIKKQLTSDDKQSLKDQT